MGDPPVESAPASHRTATWFADDRGIDRRLKVSWHPERRLLVFSLWHEDTCTTTFRLPVGQVPRLVQTLVEALGHAALSSGEAITERVRRRPHRHPR